MSGARRVAYLFPTYTMREARGPEMPPGVVSLMEDLEEEARAHLELATDPYDRPPPEERMDAESTLRAQAATFIEGLACARWAEEHVEPAEAVSYYSMGLFPALAHARALSVGDALALMKEVCLRSDRRATGTRFSLGVVIGPTGEEVRGALQGEEELEMSAEFAERVSIVCGPDADVGAFLAGWREAGAPETRKYPVAAPFHSRRLAPGREELRRVVQGYEVGRPRVPVLSSSTAAWMEDAEAVREELVVNVSSPIRWRPTMEALLEWGVEQVVECGFTREMGALLRRDHPGPYRLHQFVPLERHGRERAS